MKKLLYTLATIFVSSLAIGQTTTENYIKNTTYQVETTTGSVSNDDKIESITYFDGLGRPKQRVGVRAGANNEDIITHIEYDQYGRQNLDYLPFATSSNNGVYRTDALVGTNNFYNTEKYENTTNPYSEKHFEASPLNRILEQGAPGADWAVNKTSDSDHTIKFNYQTNIANEVLKFEISFLNGDSSQPQLQLPDSYYNAGELYKTVSKDENWKTYDGKDHTTEEFKDKAGRIILKRTYDNQKPHSTYYLYDDFGNLTYVIPPLASDKVPVYDVGMTTLAASSLITTGNPTGTIQLGIEQTGVNTFRYVASFDLHNLEPWNYNYGNIDLPHAHESVSGYLGGPYLYGNGTIGYAGKSLYFSISNGRLNMNGYYYVSLDYNGTQLLIDDIVQTNYINLPQTLIGVTEAETQANLQNVLDDLCYQYKYDSKNRLIQKKIPGKGWEYIIYDTLDRPVMTQDANLRDQDQWLFTKYDAFGRVAYTGIYTHGSQLSQNSMQSHYDSQNAQVTNYNESKVANGNGYQQSYYTNDLFPDSNIELLTINYFDDYNFSIHNSISNPNSVYGVNTSNMTKGLPTGNKIKILDTNHWTTSVNYYDDKGRIIYSASKNDFLNTTDITEFKLDFIGNITRTKTYHTKGNNPSIQVDDVMDYDHMSRLLTHKQTIAGQNEELIAKNHYDELGQLVKKDVGDSETSPLQEVDYTYNIRGWLTELNEKDIEQAENDLFEFKLGYNDVGTRLYNGNISMMSWVTANGLAADRWYLYYYDDLNRIKNSNYYEWSKNSRFNVNYSYDKNGNLTNLNRKGNIVENPVYGTASDYGTMDNLSYYYSGNQLHGVTDSSGANTGFNDGNVSDAIYNNSDDDYTYDNNGNMTKDLNKGITNIVYNHLNLPKDISINGNGNVGSISYVYDALGTKLKKSLSLGTNTLYAGNYVYEGLSGAEDLKFFSHPEGYVDTAGSGFEYVYQYKDHLGNVRLSYKEVQVTLESTPIFIDGFESLTDWDKNPTTIGRPLSALDSSKKISGNYSGRINPITSVTNDYYVVNDQWVPINNSQDTFYTFSVWVYLEDVVGNGTEIFLFTRKQGETSEWGSKLYRKGYNKDKGQWVLLEKSVKIPADVKELRVRIDNNYEGIVWFDDIKITKGNAMNTEIISENNYYPFGLKHEGYNTNVNSTNIAQKWKFQGQEDQDELGLDLIQFKWRMHDPAIGRFISIDPLAEDYVHNGTYNFAENKVISHIELEGLEGIHSSKVNGAGIRSHVIQKNVVVLTQAPRPINAGASPRKAARIQRQNARIAKSNVAKVNRVRAELKSFFSGAKNSAGESVDFQFNVTAMETNNTDGGSTRDVINIGLANGEESGEAPFTGAPNSIAPAAVITTDGSGGSEGLTEGNVKISANSSDDGVIAHEVGHTLMTGTKKEDDYPGGNGGLMDSPPGRVSSKEVDRIIEDSYEKKK